ncbi:putative sugar-proton symporter [Acidisarcina polymorpha]|uniref:Putative sugar-proton symporter n=1 Tax=Acidisarcina polymorpha TaxID=2211140 RepID=A0A2Z5G1J3_9BACT|nr:sugar porter family MFS transporter [Acidisarcina polymorpha]AXC12515.1 putative sugar-proton symporter [Acidisarcina polymorpha]
MQGPSVSAKKDLSLLTTSATAYVWGIAVVAALGGLLFGYDWVVIGGAREFFEIYFHLDSAASIGWANSCALIGCFAGSLSAGALGNRYGRKPVLIVSAILFAASSILTGWASTFAVFIAWRIAGGVAIGLSSNISPLYIAEVSPAAHRGRLVSLNQFAIVVGILLAQIANWRIARPVPLNSTHEAMLASWNVQTGWRWMFTAVAIPAVVFLLAAFGIPESPRWLLARGRAHEAETVLRKIGGDPGYATTQVAGIASALREEQSRTASWRGLLRPGVRKALLIGIVLAVLQQWSGINILFNYAEEVYRTAGIGTNQIFLDIVITGTINLLFTMAAMAVVDRLGRRPLMLFGCLGIGVSHLLAGFAYRIGVHGTAVLVLTLCAIACYAMTLAPLTWVLIAEIYPNRLRSIGVSLAVSALWISSFALTYSFPFINRTLGSSGTFFIYGSICLAGAVFVLQFVPETKGQTLEEIEAKTLGI